jgi:hypothetical protein
VIDRKAEIKQHPLGFYYVEDYKPGHKYYGGLDVARLQDWTVPTVFDRYGKLVAWDRFNVIDWEVQKARSKAVFGAYGNPPTCIDSNGVGDGIVEDWRRSMNLIEYKASSNAMKRTLVDRWAVRIIQGRTKLPQHSVLVKEHERYEAKRAKSQGSTVIQYSAPSGMTDDWVMSCALANWLIPKEVQPDDLSQKDMEARQPGLWELL